MATPDNLSQQLQALTAEQLSVATTQLVPTASLTDDLGLDSLAAIEWGMAIEDTFGLSLPEDAMERVKTYGDVEALVRSLAPSVSQV